MGLVLTEAPSGALLKTPSKGSVANVYLATWDTLDVPLQPLRDRGWNEEAEQALQDLQALTGKRLTVKNPSLPSVDAVRNWPAVRAVLQRIAGLYES
jgi:hypothetical protein